MGVKELLSIRCAVPCLPKVGADFAEQPRARKCPELVLVPHPPHPRMSGLSQWWSCSSYQ